jgi:hypothetical protein
MIRHPFRPLTPHEVAEAKAKLPLRLTARERYWRDREIRRLAITGRAARLVVDKMRAHGWRYVTIAIVLHVRAASADSSPVIVRPRRLTSDGLRACVAERLSQSEAAVRLGVTAPAIIYYLRPFGLRWKDLLAGVPVPERAAPGSDELPAPAGAVRRGPSMFGPPAPAVAPTTRRRCHECGRLHFALDPACPAGHLNPLAQETAA